MLKPKGSLLLEAIIAVGLAASFTLAVIHLALLSNEALSKVEQRGEANFLTQQMVEAVMTMKFSELTNITNGKVVFDGTKWTVQAGQEVMPNGMIRRVTIESVRRDLTTCNVVTSGGAVDVDSKKITGSVQWTDITGVFKTITHVRYHTNWEAPVGPCFGATMAENVTVNTTTAAFSGGKNLRGIYLTNGSTGPITITTVNLTWTYPGPARTVDQMFITDTSGDIKAWSSVGDVGSPVGVQSSVAVLNILDRTIAAGVQAELNKIRFSANMPGSTVSMTLNFSDGSILNIGPLTPP